MPNKIIKSDTAAPAGIGLGNEVAMATNTDLQVLKKEIQDIGTEFDMFSTEQALRILGTFTDHHILRADGSTGVQDSDPSINDNGDIIVNKEVIEQNREITRYALMVSS